MTSKISFFKLIKQDFHKRIWCPILIFLGYFLFLEVRLLMMLGRIADGEFDYVYKNAAEYVETVFFGSEMGVNAAVACFVAFVCAMSGFSYLHSKTQLDMYHSLPVNRVQLFIAKYAAGLFYFVVPYVLHIFICAAIAAGRGAMTGTAFVCALQIIGVAILVFLMAYAAFIAAICLTGHIIVSVISCGVLFCYSTITGMLLEALYSMSYITYTSVMNSGVYENFWAFSPSSILIKLFSLDYGETAAVCNAPYLWAVVAAVLAYSALAFLLYIKRASESAGRAIAFKRTEPAIKTLIVVPVALFSGIFFDELSYDDQGVWYVFGIIFGFIVCSALMEIIFRFDIKSAFKHKGQALFNAACVLLIFIIFRYDALGYDTYVPNDAELESISLSINGLMETSPVVVTENGYYYIGADEYRMENVRLQNNPSAMELARKAAAEGLNYKDADGDEGYNYRSILYGYNKSNGKTVYREYLVDISEEETLSLIADIFNDDAYKQGSNLIIGEGWKEDYAKLDCFGVYKEKTLDLTPALQSELLAVYREEFMELDFATVLDTYPVGAIAFLSQEQYDLEKKRGYSSTRYNNCLIYPQFTKTIALLKENGFDVYEELSEDEIKSFKVEYWAWDDEGYSTADCVLNIYDEDEQREILASALPSWFSWQISSYTDFFDESDDFDLEIYVYSSSDYGNNYGFKKGEVPEFVQERIEENRGGIKEE